ncbi:MAG: hypothetical protein M3P06_16730 [Acidobacteriota bacterium]|nr:hypothetical protein [Acidobacteriota bacterium]
MIIDHIAAHGQPPTNKQLRVFGHDIKELAHTVGAMKASGSTNPLRAFDPQSIEAEIIDFLAEFATTTRYYNLDALSQSQRAQAPLPRWNALLQRLVRENVPAARVMRIGQQSLDLATLIGESATVVAHDLDGTPMDLARMFAAPRLQELGCRYAVWHVIRILDALNDCLHAATWRVHSVRGPSNEVIVPFMYEFLNFTGLGRSHVLRKRRWP